MAISSDPDFLTTMRRLVQRLCVPALAGRPVDTSGWHVDAAVNNRGGLYTKNLKWLDIDQPDKDM
jgi:hypothetical protein